MRTIIRRSGYALLLSLLFAVVSQAQTAPPRRALMWKVTSPTTTLYLVGSIHLADTSVYPLPKPVEDAFAASQVLVVEVNMKKLDEDTMKSVMQSRAMYSDGSTLWQHISKPTADALDKYCADQEVPRATFDTMKPWMAAITASVIPMLKTGSDPNLGIDKHFVDAVKSTQRIEQLETLDSQLALLASGTDAEQDQFLADSLKQAPRVIEFRDRMQKAFFDGDADALQKAMDEARTGPESMNKRLLDDRNVAMIEKIDQYLKGKEQVFVVVGAGHMVGPKGIVQLLRDRKFKVEQMAAQ